MKMVVESPRMTYFWRDSEVQLMDTLLATEVTRRSHADVVRPDMGIPPIFKFKCSAHSQTIRVFRRSDSITAVKPKPFMTFF